MSLLFGRVYPWETAPLDAELVGLLERFGGNVSIQRRRVPGGELHAILACEPPERLWHLSVSHVRRHRWNRRRRPTYDELLDAVYELMPMNVSVVLRLPKQAKDEAMHLWEHRFDDEPPRIWALPPALEAEEERPLTSEGA